MTFNIVDNEFACMARVQVARRRYHKIFDWNFFGQTLLVYFNEETYT